MFSRRFLVSHTSSDATAPMRCLPNFEVIGSASLADEDVLKVYTEKAKEYHKHKNDEKWVAAFGSNSALEVRHGVYAPPPKLSDQPATDPNSDCLTHVLTTHVPKAWRQ